MISRQFCGLSKKKHVTHDSGRAIRDYGDTIILAREVIVDCIHFSLRTRLWHLLLKMIRFHHTDRCMCGNWQRIIGFVMLIGASVAVGVGL